MVKIFKAPKSSRQKKQSPDLHLTIEQLDHHGNGVNLSRQPIAVVSGALPGEDVQVEVVQSSNKVLKGKVRKVKSASSKRQAPFCPHFGICGGCQLQHLNSEDGLAMKSQALQSYIQHKLQSPTNSKEALFESPIASPDRYRRKVKLAIDARNANDIKIGFRAHRSQKVIDVQACPILDEELESSMLALKQGIMELGIAAKLGHIDILRCQEGVQVYINSVKTLSGDEIAKLRSMLHSKNIELVGPLAGATMSHDNEAIKAEPKTIEHLTAKGLLANVSDFVQVNSSVNLQLLEVALDWLEVTKTDIVADFFAGSGNFTFAIAPHVSEVKSFEVVDSMVKRIAANCEFTGTTNVSAATVDLSDSENLQDIDWASVDKVILDPARAGAEALANCMATSQEINVNAIVYVSCNPDTFIRDAQILASKYELSKLKVADMFPFTEHLELIALFTPLDLSSTKSTRDKI